MIVWKFTDVKVQNLKTGSIYDLTDFTVAQRSAYYKLLRDVAREVFKTVDFKNCKVSIVCRKDPDVTDHVDVHGDLSGEGYVELLKRSLGRVVNKHFSICDFNLRFIDGNHMKYLNTGGRIGKSKVSIELS